MNPRIEMIAVARPIKIKVPYKLTGTDIDFRVIIVTPQIANLKASNDN